MKLINHLILQGDALSVLKRMPENSIDMCMTSPPYWSLRDYQVEGQLGLESTPEEYINKLCTIFDQIKRVLKPEGSCWVNLGDTYGGNNSRALNGGRAGYGTPREGVFSRGNSKCLMQIPSRFSIEMCNRGWILRNSIIWYKPNCMPCSVKDRFTVDYEMLYFFTKNTKYYFKTQYEPIAEATIQRAKYGCNRKKTVCAVGMMTGDRFVDSYQKSVESGKRIKRCVWKISTKPFREAHFANYPP